MNLYIIIISISLLFLLSIKWCINNMYEKTEHIKIKDLSLIFTVSLFFWWLLSLFEIFSLIKKLNGNGKK